MGSRQKMTEYERRRLENIKRNDEMMAALKIQSHLSDLSAATTKRRSVETKTYKRSPVKKPKTEGPVVLRRSLRTRGVEPDAATASGLADNFNEEKRMKTSKKSYSYTSDDNFHLEPGPLEMKDAYQGDDGLDQRLVEKISGFSGTAPSIENNNRVSSKRLFGSVDPEALQLQPEHVARLLQGRIMSLKFFPTEALKMIVVGNKYGYISFWDVNSKDEDNHGIYLYHPHAGPVGGLALDPSSISKVYSSDYTGFIRLMDLEKEVFDMVCQSEHAIYNISLNPHDTRSLYYSEGNGGLNMLDTRADKTMLKCGLHDSRINTIDFNPQNENLVATSSTDGTACIWDLRRLNVDEPASLVDVHHKRAVHSAYFSPTGKFLATTSLDDTVGLLSGANYEKTDTIFHYNQTNRWISKFRGIWGWDDSSIFIGNMKRGVDIISVPDRKSILTLHSDLMTAIPCQFDAHPCRVGTLVGATSGGQVYIWTAQ